VLCKCTCHIFQNLLYRKMSHEIKFVSSWWLFEIFLNGIFNNRPKLLWSCSTLRRRRYLTRRVEEPCSLFVSKISAYPDCITLSTFETDSNAPFHTSVFEITVYMYFIQFWNIFVFFVGACMFPWPNISWLIKSRRMRRVCMWHAKERCAQSFVGQHKQKKTTWKLHM